MAEPLTATIGQDDATGPTPLLVDHHVHGVVTTALDRAGFEALITESNSAAPPGTSHFDAPIGCSLRRHCAPVIGLAPHASAEAYLGARAALGPDEVNRRLMTAAGLERLVVDTGHRPDEIAGPAEMAELAGAPADEVVRVEVVAEQLAEQCSGVEEFADRLPATLREAAVGAVGFKTVVAYRHGLDLEARPPEKGELVDGLDEWFAGGTRAPGASRRLERLTHPVVLRAVLAESLACAAEEGLVVQVHTGFGDTDLQLDRADPARFTPWIRLAATQGVTLCLLHGYPYHRQAGYLAGVFPNVYFDVGCILNYAGPSARTILAEALEFAPFTKMLYSSDAFGLAELVYLGAVQFRRGLESVLREMVAGGELCFSDAERIRFLVSAGNARRIYRFERSARLQRTGSGSAGL